MKKMLNKYANLHRGCFLEVCKCKAAQKESKIINSKCIFKN